MLSNDREVQGQRLRIVLRMRNTLKFKSDRENGGRMLEIDSWFRMAVALGGNFSLWSKSMEFPERACGGHYLTVSVNDLTM